MPLDLNADTVLYVILLGVALLLASSLTGLLAFYLGLVPVSLIGIGVGLPLYGLLRGLHAVCRTPRECWRPVEIVVGLLQCAVALYLGRALLAHQWSRALSPHAHAAARSLAEMPIVQLCLGCSCLLGCAATGMGVVVSGRAFVARLVRHLLTEA